MADQQVHRVIYGPPAGVLDRHNPQSIGRSENPVEDRFNGRTRRQDRMLSEPLPSKDMGECPFGPEVVDRSHSNLVKRQPIGCK